jgi:hypothetical protein
MKKNKNVPKKYIYNKLNLLKSSLVIRKDGWSGETIAEVPGLGNDFVLELKYKIREANGDLNLQLLLRTENDKRFLWAGITLKNNSRDTNLLSIPSKQFKTIQKADFSIVTSMEIRGNHMHFSKEYKFVMDVISLTLCTENN